jgi:hypothetical protein
MRRHGLRAARIRILVEQNIVLSMFAARVHRIAREGKKVMVTETGDRFRVIPVSRYNVRLQAI